MTWLTWTWVGIAFVWFGFAWWNLKLAKGNLALAREALEGWKRADQRNKDIAAMIEAIEFKVTS